MVGERSHPILSILRGIQVTKQVKDTGARPPRLVPSNAQGNVRDSHLAKDAGCGLHAAEFCQRLCRLQTVLARAGAEKPTRGKPRLRIPAQGLPVGGHVHINRVGLIPRIGEHDGKTGFRIVPQHVTGQLPPFGSHHHRRREIAGKNATVGQLGNVARARMGRLLREPELEAHRRARSLPVLRGQTAKLKEQESRKTDCNFPGSNLAKHKK